MRKLLAMALLLVMSVPAFAAEPDEVLPDPALEARARAISKDLRCLVCQNESIDDSHADLAKDLRLLVRERLTEGDSDAQVRDYIVARYGEFVLLKPPFNPATVLLWFGPLLVLGLGGLVVWRTLKASSEASAQEELTPEERAALAQRLSAPPSQRE